MGNPTVTTATITLKDRTGGVWGSVAPATSNWSLFSTESGENNLSASINGGKTLAWDKPTLHGDGTTISPTSLITGYEVFKKDSEERYAVRTTFSGGTSELSTPESTTTWKDSLDAPDGTNTFDSDDSLATINAYIAGRSAGDVIYLSSGGTANSGVFNFTANDTQLLIGVDGTSDFDTGYITLMGVPGEYPKLSGTYAGAGVAPTESSQTAIESTGDYNRVYGIEIYRMGKFGIQSSGESAHIEEVWGHENFSSALIYGYNGANNNLLAQYNWFERSASFPAIMQRYDHNADTFDVDGATLQRNILNRNGYAITTEENVDTSGNADGITIFKSNHNVFDDGVTAPNRDGSVEGRWNACQDLSIVQNLLLYNSDDGCDESAGEGTVLIGNIAAGNGTRGNRNFKTLCNDRGHFEDVRYIGNASIAANQTSAVTIDSVTNSGGLARFHITLGDPSPELRIQQQSVTIAGTTSYNGTGLDITTVEPSTTFNAPTWFEISTVSYVADETGTAEFENSSVGFEIQTNQDTTNGFPAPAARTVGNTALNNANGSPSGTTWAMHTESFGATGTAMNNMSHGSGGSGDLYDNDFTETTNHGDADSTPGITDSTYTGPNETYLGAYGTYTVKEIFEHKYRQILAQIMPTTSGNLDDDGTLDTNYYHALAADNATAPSDPDDLTKMHWYGTVPDIGMAQYVYIQAPLNLVIT